MSLLQLAENQPYTEKQLKVDTKRKDKDSSVDFLASEYASTPRITEPQDDKDPFEGRVDGLYLVLISLHGACARRAHGAWQGPRHRRPGKSADSFAPAFCRSVSLCTARLLVLA